MSAPARQSGLALLVVLWVISGLSIVVATVLAQTRSDVSLTRTHVDLARARAAAEAGIYRGVYELLKTRETVRFGLPEAMPRVTWPGAAAAVRIDNEAGKIDVNTADEALLRSLFEKAGSPAAATSYLARRSQRTAGFGDERPETGREFASIRAFATELDLPRDVWRTIEPWITVHNGQHGINPWVADAAVLSLVPGYTASLLKNPPDKGAPDRLQFRFMEPDDRYFTDRLSPVYTIAARASAGGVATNIEALVEMSANPRRPYTILAWDETPRFRDR